jgi:hypothetical protein
MKNKVILSSSSIDKHGDMITKGDLESRANTINGPKSVKSTIDHKRDLPPQGKIVNAEIIEKEGVSYLIADDVHYDIYEDLVWDHNLIKASCSNDKRPFNLENREASNKSIINLDPHIFKSKGEIEKYLSEFESIDHELEFVEYSRKAEFSDPEIIINLAKYWLVYKLLRPIVQKSTEKVVEKISDKITEDTEALYDLIKKSIIKLGGRIKPSKKRLSYVIQIAGKPEIELFAKIEQPNDLIKALKKNKIKTVRDEIERISEFVEIEQIQFTLDNNKWKFNYLTTDKGETIGRKKSFKKRDHKREYIQANYKGDFRSIG